MAAPMTLNALALAALVPAAVVPLRPGSGRDAPFWLSTLLALAGAGLWAHALLLGGWQTEFGTALWIVAAASAALYAVIAAITRLGWRLGPLLMPYLFAIGFIASVVRGEPKPMVGGAPAVWVDAHIIVAILALAALTLAAVASLAVFLQERALKHKRPTVLTRILPSVADAELLSSRLLLFAEVVLGLGLASGIAVQYFENGVFFRIDHKTLFSVFAFVLIGALLLGQRVCGVRGRTAARVVLVAYLLVMLASPGVKFVTQVLL